MSGTTSARAFTLIELVIALSISSIVLLAVASLIGLSTKAIPPEDGVQEVAISAGDFLGRLGADTMIARSVTEKTESAVTLIIPDQDGDATADTVRYVWTGVAGEPLARVINGTDRAELLPSVTSLSFGYEFDDVPAFAQLSKWTDGAGTLQSSLASIATSNQVGGTIYGQVFAPSLPADAIAWTLDQLTLSLGPSVWTSSTVVVEVRGCNASDLPTGAVYARATRDESKLGVLGLLPGNETFALSGVTVPASHKLCVIVRCSGGDGTVAVGTAVGLIWPAGAPALSSSDGGSSWTKGTGVILGHSIVGRATRVAGGETTRHVVSRVSVALEAGAESAVMEFGIEPRNPAETSP